MKNIQPYRFFTEELVYQKEDTESNTLMQQVYQDQIFPLIQKIIKNIKSFYRSYSENNVYNILNNIELINNIIEGGVSDNELDELNSIIETAWGFGIEEILDLEEIIDENWDSVDSFLQGLKMIQK